ncbi:TetR/AcrR family transcriptional regulator [Cumulibacter soli]|uniref:TetR/AcrR family transcriptional regulator n=1 Tax=Cumulibacter soli TaxID=2546344 RepID=UPI001067BAB0|nr:TetR/AcrR family transcriptional regulator [Cumulibacter soli]
MFSDRNAPHGPSAHTDLVSPDDDATFGTILDAAVRVFGKRGYHGTSVRDIAEAAGVSPGSLYNHFDSKHDLLVVILDRGLDNLVSASEDALYTAAPDPVSRLKALVGTHVRTHAVARIESYIGNSELRSLSRDARALIISKRDTQQRMFDRVVRDGTKQGVFTTSDPVTASRYVVTACTAVATWYRPDGDIGIDELVQKYEELSLSCVGYIGDPTDA